MKHPILHELAKFASGLVAADFLALWWFSASGTLPMEFLGVTFTDAVVAPGLVFDGILFLALVHYGWHLGSIPQPREKTYLRIAGTVFGVVAIAHLFRLFVGAPIVIAGWSAPLWLSWIGTLGTAYLSYASFHFTLRSSRK